MGDASPGDDAIPTSLAYLAAEGTRDVILVAEGSTLRWVSPSVHEMLGWTVEQFLRFSPTDVTHLDDLPRVLEQQALLDECLPVTGRARVRRADGSYLWVESRMRAICPDGRFDGWSVHSWRDVDITVAAEKQLARAAHDYRLLAEHASDVVVRGNNAGIMEWVSPSVTAVLGWDPRALAGRPFLDVVHADDRTVAAAAQAAAVAGERAAIEVRIRADDGTHRWFSIVVLPVFDDDGRVIGRVGSWHDTQAEHEARAELAASEARMRTITAFAGELIVQLSPDGRCEWASPAALTVLGWDPDHLVGVRGDDLVDPDDLSHLLETRAAVARTGVPAAARVRFRTETGELRWVDITGNPINVEGELRGYVSVIRNAEQAVAAEGTLRERGARYEMLANNSGDVALTRDDVCLWVSPPLAATLGYTAAELVGTKTTAMVHPDDVATIATARAGLRDGNAHRARSRVLCGDGEYHWFDIAGRAVADGDGTFTGLAVTSWHSVDDEVVAQHQLERSERQFRLALEGSPDGMALVGLAREFLEVNPALCQLTGHDTEWLRSHSVTDVLAPADVPLDAALRERLFAGAPPAGPVERRIVRADGPLVHVEHSLGLLRDDDGTPLFFVSHFVDITDRKVSEEQLRYAATHDPLTGLANRVLLLESIRGALRRAERSERLVAVLLVDLDHFKFVNDSLGHALGDELLSAAAQRMVHTLRDADLVARHGGDEFVVVLEGADDVATVVTLARRIVEVFRLPLILSETSLTTTASVGIAIAESGTTPDALLAEADTAMYRAKEGGRDRISVFNDELRRVVDERLHIENELRLALEHRELEMHYQPEIDLTTGEMHAVEALLRWHHPSGQLYAAGQFVEVAEETGLMPAIGAWVLRECFRQAAAWQGVSDLVVRVNLSPRQLAEGDLLDVVDSALRATGADPRRLSFEITETAIMRDSPIVAANVHGLHRRGFTLAIDDFGTGYASLTYLSEFPIGVLKLDRSFVSRVVEDDFERKLLGGVIALATSLGITTTAEGIEEPEQARVLADLGCTHGQGWFWSKAVPAAEITDQLSR